jgi:hypothetical protein
MSQENMYCDECGQVGCTGECEDDQELVSKVVTGDDLKREHKYSTLDKPEKEGEERK